MSSTSVTPNRRSLAVSADRLVYWLSRHWLLLFSLVIAVWVGLPWLAPVFMEIGWTRAGEAIYLLYSFQCHQMPQRSFFLFGPRFTVPLEQIQGTWQPTTNPLLLRQFVGNADMGWKVAWSDRMVSAYGSPLFWGLLFYWPLRRWLRPLPIWGLILLSLPMVLDGGTHLLSDAIGGIGGGFRYTNTWLATLTNNTFTASFYAGDAVGSLNFWLRLITGLLFGLGVVWFAYPRLGTAFADTARQIEAKFKQAAGCYE
ncbi:MAG TPA: DUF2085 domain-containing protein [Chloroflexota bacterium]|nr:DUF2085 domain-containing protein [Chloroflexota bacterium]